jgi:hypothetical protein
MMRMIMRKLSTWLAFVMRKGKGRLSTRRSLMRLGARRIKAREGTLPSLSLRIIKVIDRSLVITDKTDMVFDTSKSKDKDEPKQMHHIKEEAMKGILALLQEKCRKEKLYPQCGKPNHW